MEIEKKDKSDKVNAKLNTDAKIEYFSDIKKLKEIFGFFFPEKAKITVEKETKLIHRDRLYLGAEKGLNPREIDTEDILDFKGHTNPLYVQAWDEKYEKYENHKKIESNDDVDFYIGDGDTRFQSFKDEKEYFTCFVMSGFTKNKEDRDEANRWLLHFVYTNQIGNLNTAYYYFRLHDKEGMNYNEIFLHHNRGITKRKPNGHSKRTIEDYTGLIRSFDEGNYGGDTAIEMLLKKGFASINTVREIKKLETRERDDKLMAIFLGRIKPWDIKKRGKFIKINVEAWDVDYEKLDDKCKTFLNNVALKVVEYCASKTEKDKEHTIECYFDILNLFYKERIEIDNLYNKENDYL